MKPSLWAAATCSVQVDRECHRDGPGSWVRLARHLSMNCDELRRLGWKVIDGEWVCPVCVAALRKEKQES